MATRFSLVLFFLSSVLLAPVGALAFGEGGCGEGACSECHSLEKEEAGQLLSGLVDTVHKVEFSIVPGLWKIDIASKGKRSSVYMDFSKSYAISGRILRLADWTDVTGLVAGSAAGRETKADLSEIPLGDALLLGSREASTRVIVFTDPQCPYCRKIHGDLKKIVAEDPDISFYIKFFPLSSHPDSYRIAKSIICEKSMILFEKSLEDKPVPDPSCDTDAVDRTLELVKKLGIRSTPTLILPDGRIMPGYKPAAKLLSILKGGERGSAGKEGQP